MDAKPFTLFPLPLRGDENSGSFGWCIDISLKTHKLKGFVFLHVLEVSGPNRSKNKKWSEPILNPPSTISDDHHPKLPLFLMSRLGL